MLATSDPTPWWDILSAVGTLLAVVVALGIALFDHFRMQRRERAAELAQRLEDLDNTRLLILSGAQPIDGGTYAAIVNALRWHSKLIEDDEQQERFRQDWIAYNESGGHGGPLVHSMLERIEAEERAIRSS